MASKREIPAAIIPATRKSKLLRAFWTMVFLLIAAGCLLTWPLNENQQLLIRGTRMAYRSSSRLAHSASVHQLMHFYGKMASLKITMPHGSPAVASVNPDCRKAPDTTHKTLLSAANGMAGKTGLLAQNCHALPVITKSPNVPLKHVSILPNLVSGPVIPQKDAAVSQADVVVVKPQGPVQLVSLRDRATCNQGVSLNIVAHEDDDLLFMNPDIQTDIASGKCVRTVYMTAGDSGQAADYWNGREQGAKAAYAAMYHVDNTWHGEQQFLNGRLVDVSYLQDIPQVSLIFLQMPDGNLFGEGFSATNNESLDKLVSGQITEIHTVSDQTAYSKDDILAALQSIMLTDTPQFIRTQNPQGRAEGDHADHAAAATLAGLAADAYTTAHTLVQYAGYPDKALETNLNPEQITAKQAIFFAYAAHDGAVCQTAETCAETATYSHYLARQYQISQVISGQ